MTHSSSCFEYNIVAYITYIFIVYEKLLSTAIVQPGVDTGPYPCTATTYGTSLFIHLHLWFCTRTSKNGINSFLVMYFTVLGSWHANLLVFSLMVPTAQRTWVGSVSGTFVCLPCLGADRMSFLT